MYRPRSSLLVIASAVLATTWASETSGGRDAFAVSPSVQGILRTYCYDCHGEKKSKGKIRLDTLSSLEVKPRLEMMGKLQEQLHFQEMPPDDEKQPTSAERKALTDWVRHELTQANMPLIEDRLRYPDYGNAVDHEKLFNGSIREMPYTPARRWLVSPMIFTERVLDVFNLNGRERDGWRRGLYGIANPFLLPDHSGVRDYDIATLEGGHLLAMLTNADYIAQKQILAARIKLGEINANEPANKADKFSPKTTPPAFESIIFSQTPPTDEAITTAIQVQFVSVLRRMASEPELKRYLELTRSAIALGGNTKGLQQMLVTVLLESEFLYRLEFGAGTPDQHGRKMLSPWEASYAISYALGDRGPDPTLVKAANEGRLSTREDYRREVQRLLADSTYYFGPIDHTINDTASTTHPRLIRFFRDFFGYPNAVKVFKDKARSGGYYDNPDRGSAGTAGRLIREADKLVELIVKNDQQVFETLLTTDRYFLYHNISNEAGQKIIANWRELYDTLKDTDWRKNPDQVAAQYQELLKKNQIEPGKTGRGNHTNNLERVMEHFSYTFGKGVTPFTTFPWAHGNQYRYSQSYSLPSTPGIGGVYGGNDLLDYQVVQPFKVPNRKGILTHPAWLIAHSSNFHTDPIRRGRWVQEKLLAGRVPDVPITVDAVVPDSIHHTFRERVESVTEQSTCWNCHQRMNPLGYPFEQFDDFGRFRTEESLEYPENIIAKAKDKNGADTYKTKPVNTVGKLLGTGDLTLDGPVSNSFDLIDRLAKSTRVRQSIIRHAFRFFMGRNELLSDSQTLIAADKAYVESGGSFKAVVVSLLTSDSFIYRK